MYTLDELRRVVGRRASVASASVLSLPQLAAAAGAELVSGGPLSCIALLRYDKHGPAFTARRLSTSEAAHALAAVRFGLRSEPRVATVLERAIGIDDPPTVSVDTMEQLADQVPCFELCTGPALLAAGGLGAALLDALAAG